MDWRSSQKKPVARACAGSDFAANRDTAQDGFARSMFKWRIFVVDRKPVSDVPLERIRDSLHKLTVLISDRGSQCTCFVDCNEALP